jgi:hypothetical protein
LGETDAYQLKYYAPNVGEVRVGWRGEDATQEELELIELTQLSAEELAEVRAMTLELEQHAYEISSEVYGQTPPAEISATEEIPPTGPSLLTGRVTMCDTGGNLINFRLAELPPDLTGKTLTAQIAEQESTCYINPTNPSLMTCTLPPGVTFPAQVVVTMDGAVVIDFVYDGLECAQITTPIPTTTP